MVICETNRIREFSQICDLYIHTPGTTSLIVMRKQITIMSIGQNENDTLKQPHGITRHHNHGGCENHSLKHSRTHTNTHAPQQTHTKHAHITTQATMTLRILSYWKNKPIKWRDGYYFSSTLHIVHILVFLLSINCSCPSSCP